MPKNKSQADSNKKESTSKEKQSDQQASKPSFPIVGIGASAGGLEALQTFFGGLDKDIGMAFVVVVHLKSEQTSYLPGLLQKNCNIAVSTVQDGENVQPNHVYIIPPGKDLSIFHGTLQLMDRTKKPVPVPIDHFFRSLADDQKGNAAAIILSGTGSDGSVGIRSVKEKEGLVLVQTEASAAYSGMPHSAIDTGVVDLVLPPRDMPRQLVQYFDHTLKKLPEASESDDQQAWLNKVFAILRARIKYDFSYYKSNTIVRRIHRRMGLNEIDKKETYLRFLRDNQSEVKALFQELLIGVTNFFRDPEAFDILKKKILLPRLEAMEDQDKFRIWVPGCSTGEEVYSLAIIVRELMDELDKDIKLQIFGSDIDQVAIDKARHGQYPLSIAADVGENRLKRFFSKNGDMYQVRNDIRDCVIFSVQDVINDPPFPYLDMITCRNLLIYLNSDAQKKLFPVFHYTLKPNGILMLGSSETVGHFNKLFSVLNAKWKIFQRRSVPSSLRDTINFPTGHAAERSQTTEQSTAPSKLKQPVMHELMQKSILDQFAPTAILVDADAEILHVQGRTGKYLEMPSGAPTNNILNQARDGLRIYLAAAFRSARNSGEKVTRKRIPVKINGDAQVINLHIAPQQKPEALAGKFLIVFEDVNIETNDTLSNSNGNDDEPRIKELEHELQSTRESNHVTVEELEATNEELKSTNEELQSSNEELQSTNEEVESSKEELQSLNEELQTVNAELNAKLEELSASRDDMRNLLNSTQIATLFLDNDLKIRRYTEKVTEIFNLIPSDRGRPLEHVVHDLDYEDLDKDLWEVHRSLVPKDVEVCSLKGQWYKMRIMPYRTTENHIDGLVLTFSSIQQQIEHQHTLQQMRKKTQAMETLLRAVFDMNPQPFVVVDDDGIIVIANTAFSEFVEWKRDEMEGKPLLEFANNKSEKERLQSKLSTALKDNTDFELDELKMKTKTKSLVCGLDGRVLKADGDFPYRLLLRFMRNSK